MKLFNSILFFLLLSCGPAEIQKQEKTETTSYSSEINKFRQQKELMFATDQNSPFYAMKDTVKYTHLNYFEVDEKYKITANITRPAVALPVIIKDTKGGSRDMTIEAILEFSIDGKKHKLNGYGSADEPGSLFIPFKDETNNKTTYGGGRYLEIPFKGETMLVIDFNFAFNPYCHYNHTYSCPIVPKENSLKCSILSGEKNYH